MQYFISFNERIQVFSEVIIVLMDLNIHLF